VSSERGTQGSTTRLVVAGVAWAVLSVLAFLSLDVVVAAFVVILGLTGVVIAVLAHDWDTHSSFEERELARARRRKAKWDAGQAARDADRARWEAHQARTRRTGGDPDR
jgi:hypothetical protein